MLVLSPRFIAARRESKNLDRTFSEYTDALVGQRYDDAYERCRSDFRSAMSYDQFVALYQSLQQEFGPLKSARRMASEVHASGTPILWRAVIDADLVYEKKNVPFEFIFHKEHDSWVLFGTEQQ